MKALLQSTLILLLAAAGVMPANAQWELYNQNDVRGRYFVDGDIGIVQGSGSGIHVTADDGATWTPVSPPWGGSNQARMFLRFKDRYYMYGNVGTDSFLRTTDSVENWEIVPGLEKSGGSHGLSWMATNGDVLWIRTFPDTDHPNGMIFTSEDGENWTYVADAVGHGGHTFYEGELIARAGNTIVSSTDYGATWETAADLGDRHIAEFLPGKDALYAIIEDADDHKTFEVSQDDGITWTKLFDQDGLYGLRPLIFQDGLLVFSGFDMFVSHDGGQSWTQPDPQPAWADHVFADQEYVYVSKTVFDKWIRRLPLSALNLTATSSEDASELPASVVLEANFPNPFNPSTTISFTLTQAEHVDLRVYDALGREVAVLVNEVRPGGRAEVSFEAAGLTSGVYLYRLSTQSEVQTRRMVLLK